MEKSILKNAQRRINIIKYTKRDNRCVQYFDNTLNNFDDIIGNNFNNKITKKMANNTDLKFDDVKLTNTKGGKIIETKKLINITYLLTILIYIIIRPST
jgi:hypothetical protein